MSTRRRPGEGTIRTLPSGRHQPGVTLANGKRSWARETYATREEAEQALLAIRAVIADQPVGGATFAAYGKTVLDSAERRKLYSPQTMDSYRMRFARSLCSAPWSDWPLRAATPHAVQKHLDSIDAELSRSSAVIALAVARLVFRSAMRDRLISADPTAGYKFPRRGRRDADDETRSFISPDQFAALLEVATPAEACMMRFAIATGLRVGELATLHLRDVHDDERPRIVVRYGGRHGGQCTPTKSGKPRTVPLIGYALDALREWMTDHLPAMANARGLLFPAPDGGYRTVPRFLYGKSGGVERWRQLLRAARLDDVRPRIVWHSFRHTCATWLLSGLFGHKWQPDEVQRILGHVSISTTLGYARIVDERLAETAARTSTRDDHEAEKAARIAGREGKKNFRDNAEWYREVRSASEQAVIAIARGEFDAAEALARMVLAHPMVVLALAVLDGGPFAANRALELVRVVGVDAGTQARDARGR